MEVKALINTLTDRVAEVNARSVRDTLGHVENYSLVNKFAATLAEMKVQAEALVDTTADTLPEVRARIVMTY